MRPSWLAAPGLLALVASIQVALALGWDLSPWLGGGFGMFATIDSRSERRLVVHVDAPGLIRTARISPELEDLERRARAFPTPARIRAFAQRVLAREHERISGVTGVRVQHWRSERGADLAPTERLVQEVEVTLDGG